MASVLTHPVLIRPARAEECESLSELARRSKAVWGYDAAFMAACHEELAVQPARVAAGDVFDLLAPSASS